MTPIAVTLLTGFLGAGKTTLLRHILNEQHGFKIAVIENEFGEVSVDDQLIGDRATQIKTLTNGCICCTRSNELEDALLDLLDSRDRGDIDLSQLFNTSGFMLEESVLASQPRFHFIADKQNDVSSIVVELDYPVDISEVSRVMENLLLESADKLLRYKGMLWIDGEPNRLLFQGVQRLYSADWDRPWGDETPHSTLVFIGIQLPEDEIRAAFAGLRK
ncbi:hypothetical protein H9V75_001935 [Salmonella enterica subsp. enterica serovar Enteritidis]|nr:hypothetical protein [Salmonella enterica subsp. enterica serovar Enteritidis]